MLKLKPRGFPRLSPTRAGVASPVMSTQDEIRSLPPEYATVDGRLTASPAGSTAHLSSLPPPTYVTLPNEDDSSDAGTADIPAPPRRLRLQQWRTQTGAADRLGAPGETSVASPTTQSGYYVYYRLFAPHGALVPQTSFDQSDPLVARRVKTSSFTPPYYPISLIRRLADAESIHETSHLNLKLTLYKACTSDAPMSPQKLVPNIGINTGSTPKEALALVAENLPPEFVRARGPRTASTAQHGHYVYYRLFASDGALVPQTSFDPSDPLVGRVMTTFVCPPYYPASLFRCLADAEHIPQAGKWRLYKVRTSDTPMSERQLVGKLGVDVGSTPEEALMLVADNLPAAFTEGRAYAGAAQPGASQCVYYSLHHAAGSIPSRHAFDPSEPHIGFLDRDLMPPPECGRTLKACIARAEGKPLSLYWDLHVYDPSRGTYQVLDDLRQVTWMGMATVSISYQTESIPRTELRWVDVKRPTPPFRAMQPSSGRHFTCLVAQRDESVANAGPLHSQPIHLDPTSTPPLHRRARA
ncbi:hypothetical protein HMN09_01084900 [Mycena chlorophos]|uniref:Uncharacterized protein n=1 Tax=Mycena chlorophos TaxID=658473 RepID=A0A8H6SAW2_MYCCL|nr:hypothetical protein HMN09_01084900 [Mycena chlorophos]